MDLYRETFGAAGDPAILLIGGVSAAMDWWETEFCERLAAAGRFVIRYDHRDTGQSPTSPAGKPQYTGEDLATDPVRLLDALGVERAHLVGVSMGGGIAQHVGARYADRVRTLTLIETSPAGERVGRQPLPAGNAPAGPPAPDWHDRAAVIDYLVESQRVYSGVPFDEDRVRRLATQVVDRSPDMAASMTNHLLAPGGPPAFRLADITAPTLVLHGTADPLFPLGHGAALADEIPNARFVRLENMGHEYPPARLWDVVIPEIVQHTSGETRYS
ncbi:MAG TPA: alpha/beta hydrolase [Amycolatopsis sp.]|nr:alpha/beta hydrolase [Amycolatopsis sp.]